MTGGVIGAFACGAVAAVGGPLPGGILLPQEILETTWFSVLATFVALNTVAYVVVSIVKILPAVRIFSRRGGRNRRAETRSIYPDGGPPAAG
ncbi:hypothetical protein [Leucobacter massiliensis]|uniref:hypothetical protein n=1 Tax=Leucobacter massiliensis TaxID=1686285 RepID=UPI000CFE41A3|nr:hypothetical protein [Leucobacter massiliensis]